MDLNIETINHEDFIEIILDCEYTYETGEILIKRTIEDSIKYKTKKVLLNALKLSQPKNLMVRFTWGEKSAEAWRGKLKVASLVDDNPERKFIETVYTNRGGHGKMFTEREKALDWLLSD